MISLMSSGEKPPSVSAERTCRRNSSHAPSAMVVPITRIRRVRSSKCGRVHTTPHGLRVISSWNSELNAVLAAVCLSTQAAPSTLRRMLMPRSYRCFSSMMVSSLVAHASCPALCRASVPWGVAMTWMAGTSPAMTKASSLQETEHRVDVDLRLLEVGDVCRLERRELGAFDGLLDRLSGGRRRRRVLGADDHQGRRGNARVGVAQVHVAHRVAAAEEA